MHSIPCDWCGVPTSKPYKYCRGTRCKLDAQSSTKQALSSVSTIDSLAILLKQKLKCIGCRQHYPMPIMQNDHIHPTSREGNRKDFTNIQIMCSACNRIKHNRTMEEFRNAHRAWYEFKSSRDHAIFNFLNYCKHKRIKHRCTALINKVLPPQTPTEVTSARKVQLAIKRFETKV